MFKWGQNRLSFSLYVVFYLHQNKVKFGCQGHRNGVKFDCRGHWNGVTFGCRGHPNGINFNPKKDLMKFYWISWSKK